MVKIDDDPQEPGRWTDPPPPRKRKRTESKPRAGAGRPPSVPGGRPRSLPSIALSEEEYAMLGSIREWFEVSTPEAVRLAIRALATTVKNS